MNVTAFSWRGVLWTCIKATRKPQTCRYPHYPNRRAETVRMETLAYMMDEDYFSIDGADYRLSRINDAGLERELSKADKRRLEEFFERVGELDATIGDDEAAHKDTLRLLDLEKSKAADLLEACKAMDALIEKLMPAVDWGKTFNLPIRELNDAPLLAKAAIAKAAPANPAP